MLEATGPFGLTKIKLATIGVLLIEIHIFCLMSFTSRSLAAAFPLFPLFSRHSAFAIALQGEGRPQILFFNSRALEENPMQKATLEDGKS